MIFDPVAVMEPQACDADMVRRTLAIMSLASDDDIQFARDVDTDVARPFADFIESEELPTLSWKQCRGIYAYADAFVEQLLLPAKYRFNVDRPFVVAERLGLEFPRPFTSSSATCPSYPSGHAGWATMIAHGLTWVLREQLSDAQRSGIFAIANRVALSRVQIGVHTLQDVAEGRRLAHAAASANPPEHIPQVRV